MVKSKRYRKGKLEKGSIPALISLVLSILAFSLWAIYIPFTFHKVGSLVCLAIILPLCLILIILGIVSGAVALKLGAGKRKFTAIIGLIFSISQVILWIGWIIFTNLWNIGSLE